MMRNTQIFLKNTSLLFKPAEYVSKPGPRASNMETAVEPLATNEWPTKHAPHAVSSHNKVSFRISAGMPPLHQKHLRRHPCSSPHRSRALRRARSILGGCRRKAHMPLLRGQARRVGSGQRGKYGAETKVRIRLVIR